MRIAIFSDSWYPYVSGVVRSIEIFKAELEQMGHVIYLFVPDYGKKSQKEAGVYRFFAIPAIFNPGFRLAVPLSMHLGRVLKELSIDIVHSQSPMIMGRAGFSCSRRLDLPFVFTHHTLYDLYTHYAGVLAGPATRYLTRYVRSFANKSDLVITPTKVVAKRLSAGGVTAPIKDVATGVVLKEFEDLEKDWLRRNLQIANEDPIVLCVARLGLEKNIFMLLDSFALISKSLPRAKLVLVGLGPLGRKIKEYARSMGLNDTFYLLDREFTRKDLAAIYASADLFLYPSVTETQGIIINEAQAAGLPVVAVGAHGVTEMVSDGIDGLLTAADPAALSEAAMKVLGSSELKKNLQQGARRAAERISSEKMAEKMISAYQQALSGA